MATCSYMAPKWTEQVMDSLWTSVETKALHFKDLPSGKCQAVLLLAVLGSSVAANQQIYVR